MNQDLPAPKFTGLAAPSVGFDPSRQQLRSMPFVYDVDLSTARAAGSMLALPIAGNTFYIDQKQNGGTARVHFQDQTPSSAGITVYPGFLARLPFTQIAIENDAQPGVTMRIVYGTDLSFTPTSAAGVSLLNPVSVIDGTLSHTLANQAFWTGVGVAGVVGKITGVALWNVAGSGKNLVVNKIRAMRDTAGILAMTDLSVIPPTSVSFGYPKFLGHALSTAGEFFTDVTQVALPGVGIFNDQFAANTTQEFALVEPVIIPPGRGLGIYSPDNQVTVRSNFQWWEIGA